MKGSNVGKEERQRKRSTEERQRINDERQRRRGSDERQRRRGSGEKQRKISLEERHRKISDEEHRRRISSEERLRLLHSDEAVSCGASEQYDMKCHLLPPLLEYNPPVEISFRLDPAMERRGRNNNAAMADINGLLAKQAQMPWLLDGQELPKYGSADEFYDLQEEIGKGAYGIVKKCVDKASGRCCAAKVVTTSNSNLRKETMREIEMMRALGSHKKLVGLIDAYHTPFEIVMILEFVAGGELFERIIEEDYLMEEDAISYVQQVLQALEFMHSKNIVHLDLKPENIMCESNDCNQIKLVDFGLARQLQVGEEVKSSFGTPDFVAPEVIRMKPVSKASDMWSLGVVTYVLLSGLMPFSGDNDHETLMKVAKADWDFDDDCFDDVSEDAKDFIEGLLVKEARERFTIAECLGLPWIKAQHQMGKIDTKKHKSFLAKRRWKKSINALVAVRRMSLSPLATRARRPSVDTALGKNKPDEGSERKASFPSTLPKALPQKRITQTQAKLNIDSGDSSFDKWEDRKTQARPKNDACQQKTGGCEMTKLPRHKVIGDASTPTQISDEKDQSHEQDYSSGETAEVNNNEKSSRCQETKGTSKVRQFTPVDRVVLNIDTKGLATKRGEEIVGMRLQTTEDNHLVLSQQIKVEMQHGLRVRSSSYNGPVPSIIVNDNASGQISPKNVLVRTMYATPEHRFAKRAVCTTQTSSSNTHVCSQSTTDQTIAGSGLSSFTLRTVDPKGQTITVKLDGINSLDVPISRKTCNHVRRASTGSEPSSFFNTDHKLS